LEAYIARQVANYAERKIEEGVEKISKIELLPPQEERRVMKSLKDDVLPGNFHLKPKGKGKNQKGKGPHLGKGNELNPKVFIRVRVTIPSQTVVTTAGSVVALTSFSNDSLRSASTEFASYAARWSHWRTLSMTAIFSPVWPAATREFANGVGHSQLFVANYWGIESTNPSTTAELLSIPGCKIVPTNKQFRHMISYKGYIDDHLWCPVNAAVPTDQALRVYLGSPAVPIMDVSETYFVFCVIAECEFMGVI